METHLTLYEALMLQMIVARIVEAYEHDTKERD
jgi:hypothetical protein